MRNVHATLEKGKLTIDMDDVFAGLDAEAKAQLIQYLACDTQVIDEVINQVLDGCTSEGWHGATSGHGNTWCRYGIDAARVRVAQSASEQARLEIEALQARVRELSDRLQAEREDRSRFERNGYF